VVPRPPNPAAVVAGADAAAVHNNTHKIKSSLFKNTEAQELD